MRVVLDTNILLISLPSRSPYHSIIQAFNERRFELVVSTPIFLEYEEILAMKANPFVASDILGALLEAPNVINIDAYYYWELISADPDDNKFTDAYMNGGGDYLVTNDSHFSQVKAIPFPKIQVVSATEFLAIISK